MEKVNVTGEKYVHYFKMNNDSIVEVETTEQDYLQLGQQNPVNPTIANGVWTHSMSRRKVDTVSGDLEKGQYFEEINGDIVAKLADNKDHVEPTMEKMIEKDIEIKQKIDSKEIDEVKITKI